MKINAEFVTSAVAPSGYPKEQLPELALVGRSNVGKSTVINALARQKLARTSAAPGKTRLANFYRLAAEGLPPFHLVDLPGYGYARGGDASAREFQELTAAYFASREHRRESASSASRANTSSADFAVLQLVDSRHPGLESDLHAWAWLGALAAPRRVIATKLDKLSRAERTRHLKEFERLHASPVLGISAQTGEGLKELWELIATLVRPLPKKPAPLPPPPNR